MYLKLLEQNNTVRVKESKITDMLQITCKIKIRLKY